MKITVYSLEQSSQVANNVYPSDAKQVEVDEMIQNYYDCKIMAVKLTNNCKCLFCGAVNPCIKDIAIDCVSCGAAIDSAINAVKYFTVVVKNEVGIEKMQLRLDHLPKDMGEEQHIVYLLQNNFDIGYNCGSGHITDLKKRD